MTVKYATQPILFKRGVTSAADTYIGPDGELLLDVRNVNPDVKIHDGVTPGGLIMNPVAITGVIQPIIQLPIDGAIGVNRSPIITASAFFGITATRTEDTHGSTTWQIASDPYFNNSVWSVVDDTTNLTSIDLSTLSVVLPANTLLYIRAAYTSTTGIQSPWSPTSTITTGN